MLKANVTQLKFNTHIYSLMNFCAPNKDKNGHEADFVVIETELIYLFQNEIIQSLCSLT